MGPELWKRWRFGGFETMARQDMNPAAASEPDRITIRIILPSGDIQAPPG